MVEAPLVSDGKVVNVTSSMVTTPLIKSGHCSDMNGLSARVVFVKRTSGAWSSGAESMQAERIALRGYSVIGTVLRRTRVVGSTSKTVSLGWFRGSTVFAGGGSEICGSSRDRKFLVHVLVSDRVG